MGNTQDAITSYEVWVAGDFHMYKYGIYSTLEEAMKAAKNRRRFCIGTIYVEEVVRKIVGNC